MEHRKKSDYSTLECFYQSANGWDGSINAQTPRILYISSANKVSSTSLFHVNSTSSFGCGDTQWKREQMLLLCAPFTFPQAPTVTSSPSRQLTHCFNKLQSQVLLTTGYLMYWGGMARGKTTSCISLQTKLPRFFSMLIYCLCLKRERFIKMSITVRILQFYKPCRNYSGAHMSCSWSLPLGLEHAHSNVQAA